MFKCPSSHAQGGLLASIWAITEFLCIWVLWQNQPLKIYLRKASAVLSQGWTSVLLLLYLVILLEVNCWPCLSLKKCRNSMWSICEALTNSGNVSDFSYWSFAHLAFGCCTWKHFQSSCPSVYRLISCMWFRPKLTNMLNLRDFYPSDFWLWCSMPISVFVS